MAEKHPYVSGTGTLVKIISQFRSSFPATVNAATLQKLGLAPKNESYVLNILRFLQLIDEKGARTTVAAEIFHQHDDEKFSSMLAQAVERAYTGLFELHGQKAWDLGSSALITYFRSTDHTTALVGGRQAGTFKALAALAGHGEAPQPRSVQARAGTKEKATPPKRVEKEKETSKPKKVDEKPLQGDDRKVGLTVRIEVNLPSDATQEAYDRIFRSIRENLLNG